MCRKHVFVYILNQELGMTKLMLIPCLNLQTNYASYIYIFFISSVKYIYLHTIT